jgi:UDP-N-acetylmuramoylalanine--D-glutamate ligase
MLNALKGAASVELLDGSFTRKTLIPKLVENGIEYNGPYKKMEEAVKTASSLLDDKCTMLQVVLLSPGAAAYEYYGNEYVRGDAFKEAINQLVRQDSSST